MKKKPHDETTRGEIVKRLNGFDPVNQPINTAVILTGVNPKDILDLAEMAHYKTVLIASCTRCQNE